MKFSSRIEEVKRVHWHMVRKLINAKEAQGVKTISLASGNPDLPTPPSIVEAACEALRDPTYHRYPFSFQTGYGEAVASWYRDRFDVELNPLTEVRPIAGSQEGIGNLVMTVMEPGTIALIPAPAYDSYARITRFAGGEVYPLPLTAQNEFLPDLKAIPADVLDRARLLWLNYPNNPTGAIAPLSFFDEVVDFARRNDIWVCHDNAYSDVCFDGYRAPSFLAADGAKAVGIELNTLSKAFNMAGWRLGMAVGNEELLGAMAFVSFNTSMGLFGPSQIAAIEALSADKGWLQERNALYRERRDILVDGLRAIGLELQRPRATLYVWAKLPPAYPDSLEFSKWVLDQTGVWITSGVFFGPAGEGYVRGSITLPTEDLIEAMERLQTLKL
jgi:LL-diaminopimelate aminotransferase